MTGAVGSRPRRDPEEPRTLGVSEACGVSGAFVTGEAADQGWLAARVKGRPAAPLVAAGSAGRVAEWPGRTAAPAGPAGPGAATRRDQAVVVPAASSRPSSATEVSRILNFWILPVTVIGNSLVYRKYRGIL